MYFQMENQVVVSDYTQMDRVLREERQYILDICKKIKKAGCNVLLIQKSILRFVANWNSVYKFCNIFVLLLGVICTLLTEVEKQIVLLRFVFCKAER